MNLLVVTLLTGRRSRFRRRRGVGTALVHCGWHRGCVLGRRHRRNIAIVRRILVGVLRPQVTLKHVELVGTHGRQRRHEPHGTVRLRGVDPHISPQAFAREVRSLGGLVAHVGDDMGHLRITHDHILTTDGKTTALEFVRYPSNL